MLKEHFHKSTDADCAVVWDQVKGLDFDRDVKHAITEHRLEKGASAFRPDPRRIRYIAYSSFNTRQRNAAVKEKIVDSIRKRDLIRWDGEPAVRIIQTHFSEAWDTVKAGDASEYGKQIARAYIFRDAITAFREIDMSDKNAEAEARDCVELKSGERIKPHRTMFNKLPELQTSWEALKRLAISEHGKPDELHPAHHAPAGGERVEA